MWLDIITKMINVKESEGRDVATLNALNKSTIQGKLILVKTK